jgi:hypothetical protein
MDDKLSFGWHGQKNKGMNYFVEGNPTEQENI